MSAAEDVVHKKHILLDDMDMPIFLQLMEAFMSSENVSPLTKNVWDGREPWEEVGQMRRVTQMSENFYVAKNMMELAQAVAPEMPDEELLSHDLPSESGWMVFGTPYRVIDIRRKMLSVDAIMWSSYGGKVRLWHFTHRDTQEDSVNIWMRHNFSERQMRELPIWNVNHIFEMEFGKRLPRGISWDTALPWDAEVDVELQDQPDGTQAMVISTDHFVDTTERPKHIRSPMCAFIVCLWRLCQQSLASVEREYPNRQARRRSLRRNLPDKPVSVVTLRRHSQREHDEAHVEWTHRWLVRGHWRRQPYRENGETVYRHIYIHPFIKGPEDKPLLVRERVNALVR